jgi:8-oxo-dGTP pyrophosphatase MutT (NUDIX family)
MKKEPDFYQVSLKLILKNNNNEILLMKALPKDTYGGFYDFPGGRVDMDEFSIPLPEVLKREVREEIGEVDYKLNPIPVAVARHLIPANISVHKRDVHVLYLLYEGTYSKGDITISHEHTGHEWVDLTKEDPEKFLKSGNLEGVKMYLKRNRVE